ncbi:MAG: 50S ribosomal protein L25/general stress protein Ctc [Actinomycetota bacterium]
MEVNLKAKPREQTGKGPARRARSGGEVPGVLYGRGLEPTPLIVDARDMDKALGTEAGANVLINLQLDGKTKHFTMLREVQRNPIRGDVLHVDFVRIERDVKIQAEVPVHLVGEARGVKEGGVIEHHLWEIKIEALPGDVPPSIEVNISRIGIGEHLRVADIDAPPGTEILTSAEEITVSVVEPQVIQLPEDVAAEEAAAAEAEAAAAEGEVPAAEGEAPPAAEGESSSDE